MLIIILIVGVFYLQRLQLTKTKKSRSVLVVYYYMQRSERKNILYQGETPARFMYLPLHKLALLTDSLPQVTLISPFDTITHHSLTITLVPLKTLD